MFSDIDRQAAFLRSHNESIGDVSKFSPAISRLAFHRVSTSLTTTHSEINREMKQDSHNLHSTNEALQTPLTKQIQHQPWVSALQQISSRAPPQAALETSLHQAATTTVITLLTLLEAHQT
jgi:hypothetical protein